MRTPKGGIFKRDILDQHSMTLIELHQRWTQKAIFSKDSLFRRDACFSHFKKFFPSYRLILSGNQTPMRFRMRAFPRPPSIVISITIDNTLASNSNVRRPIGINQWLQPHHFHAFPASKNGGQIGRWICCKAQLSARVFGSTPGARPLSGRMVG